MKVHKRSYPLDTLNFEQGDTAVYITTHRHQIVASVVRGDKPERSDWMTFDQFVNLLSLPTAVHPILEDAALKQPGILDDPTWSEDYTIEISLSVAELRRLALLSAYSEPHP